jgi:nucleoside-diphosphate-sugar epimerase
MSSSVTTTTTPTASHRLPALLHRPGPRGASDGVHNSPTCSGREAGADVRRRGSRRDYTYVDDIVDGLVATLDLAPGFEILNLGGAETTSLADLVRWIAEELAVEPRIEYLPAQPGDVPITYADVSKASRLLGYAPKVPIREGLRRFVSWYRESQSRS